MVVKLGLVPQSGVPLSEHGAVAESAYDFLASPRTITVHGPQSLRHRGFRRTHREPSRGPGDREGEGRDHLGAFGMGAPRKPGRPPKAAVAGHHRRHALSPRRSGRRCLPNIARCLTAETLPRRFLAWCARSTRAYLRRRSSRYREERASTRRRKSVKPAKKKPAKRAKRVAKKTTRAAPAAKKKVQAKRVAKKVTKRVPKKAKAPVSSPAPSAAPATAATPI